MIALPAPRLEREALHQQRVGVKHEAQEVDHGFGEERLACGLEEHVDVLHTHRAHVRSWRKRTPEVLARSEEAEPVVADPERTTEVRPDSFAHGSGYGILQ